MRIQTKLILGFLAVSLIPLVIIGFLGVNASQASLEEQIKNHLKTAVTARAKHIETFLNVKKARILDFSSDGFIKNSLFALKDRDINSIQVMNDLTEHLIVNKLLVDKELYEVFVLDPNGKVVGTTNPKEEFEEDFSTDLLFSEGGKNMFIKDVFFDQEFEQNAFALSAPVLKEKEFVGVVIIRISSDSLAEITTDITGLGSTGEIYLVNKEGYMITPSRFKQDVILKQKVDTENTEDCFEDIEKFADSAEIEEHEEDVPIFADYRGVMVLGAHSYVPEMEWCVLAEIDETEAFAPVKDLKNKTMYLGFALVILIFILSYVLSNIITRGINDRDKLLNSLLKTFKGKFGNIATILVRKDVQEMVKKNPRIEKILPESLKKSSKKEGE